jgi:hypothetical protein
MVDENETIDLTMCVIPKRARKERIKGEFTSLMSDKYEEYDQIYTNGFLKDDKLGFAIVTNNQTIKKRLRPPSSIYSAEQQAIITAMDAMDDMCGVRYCLDDRVELAIRERDDSYNVWSNNLNRIRGDRLWVDYIWWRGSTLNLSRLI